MSWSRIASLVFAILGSVGAAASAIGAINPKLGAIAAILGLIVAGTNERIQGGVTVPQKREEAAQSDRAAATARLS